MKYDCDGLATEQANLVHGDGKETANVDQRKESNGQACPWV